MMKKIMRTVVSLLMAVTSMALIAGCGKENKEPPHEHAWDAGVIVTNATCTEKGSKKFSCECGEEKTEDIAALGHDLEQVAGKDATCTEFGWNAYEKCNRTNCNHTTYSEIPAKEHAWVNGECTRDGCDETTIVGHEQCVWDEGVVTKNPTCTEAGVKTFTCQNDSCKAPKTESIEELGHSFEDRVCKTCGEKEYYIVSYYIVYNNKVVALDTYAVMKDSAGNYPTRVEPTDNTITISSLKEKGQSSEYVEVTSNMGLKFVGWYLDEACKQSLGKTASITVSDDIAVYAYCKHEFWIGPH